MAYYLNPDLTFTRVKDKRKRTKTKKRVKQAKLSRRINRHK